jgi:hypothetical protein
MEIPRHWRLKDIRYKLIGWKYGKDGTLDIQKRPIPKDNNDKPLEARGTIFSSRLPSYTSGSYMVEQEMQQQKQEL